MHVFVREIVEMRRDVTRSSIDRGAQSSSFEVLFAVGLGPLRFRMSEDEVEEVLGPPEDVAEFDLDKHLYYDRLGIYLFFGEDQGRVLSGIEVNERCRCTIAGERIFPRRREQVIQLLQSACGLSSDQTVVYLEDAGESRIKIAHLAADFYFSREGSLVSINWSEVDNS